MWWGIYILPCYKFPTESNSEKILKIGKYLVKLWTRVWCLVFLTHGVVVVVVVVVLVVVVVVVVSSCSSFSCCSCSCRCD